MIQNLDIAKLQRVAAQLKEVVPKHSLMIAGGAPRDILNGRPVKDIDVFIGLDGDHSQMANDWLEICMDVLKLYPQHSEQQYERADAAGNKRLVWHQHQGSYEASGALNLINAKGYSYGAFSLVEFQQGPYCHALQLVFIDMDPVENVRNHFDFGLSKVWVTPNQVRMDKAYWHDHFGQRITYLNSTEPNEQRKLSSVERVKRLRQKYAGWRFERCWPLDNPLVATPAEVPAELKF
jgi:hypothetical protein